MANWKRYRNGNYSVAINLEDGTKIRQTINPDDYEFIPEFAESVDLCIGRRCDGGCPYCYEDATPDGKNGDLLDDNLINSFHPYTEVAINGNSVDHPQLEEFLRRLKARNVIANMTVNQVHFEREQEKIRKLVDEKLIYGLGVSLRAASPGFVQLVKEYPNAVIHVINGIFDENDAWILRGNNLKILILGYKRIGRGMKYASSAVSHVRILDNMIWLNSELPKLIKDFAVVSFDNLAIKQLNVKDLMTSEQWNEFYMGDDGNFTFYIDMAERKFGISSLVDKSEMIPMENMTVDQMFNIVRANRPVGMVVDEIR